MTSFVTPALLRALADARARGFLGAAPVEEHVAQAAVLAAAHDTDWEGSVLDLGSGAGVPGLILALAWPRSHWTLLDAHRRRMVFAQEAARGLGLADRVHTLTARAEEAAHSEVRGSFDEVVARGFGPPAVVAECGAPLLRRGGVLWVTEPPEDVDRWPAPGLAQLGLRNEGLRIGPQGRWRRLVLTGVVPDELPRRVGVPRRRPLF